MIRVLSIVRTVEPIRATLLRGMKVVSVVLSGKYTVEQVRGDDVRIGGVWVPARFVEKAR